MYGCPYHICNHSVEAHDARRNYGHLLIHELRLERQTVPVSTGGYSQQPWPRFFLSAVICLFRHDSNSSGRNHSSGSVHGSPNTASFQNNCPLCQLCNKYDRNTLKFYDHFDYSFQSEGQSNVFVFVASPGTSGDLPWYPDIGATNHMTFDLSNLTLQAEEYYTGPDQVRVDK